MSTKTSQSAGSGNRSAALVVVMATRLSASNTRLSHQVVKVNHRHLKNGSPISVSARFCSQRLVLAHSLHIKQTLLTSGSYI